MWARRYVVSSGSWDSSLGTCSRTHVRVGCLTDRLCEIQPSVTPGFCRMISVSCTPLGGDDSCVVAICNVADYSGDRRAPRAASREPSADRVTDSPTRASGFEEVDAPPVGDDVDPTERLTRHSVHFDLPHSTHAWDEGIDSFQAHGRALISSAGAESGPRSRARAPPGHPREARERRRRPGPPRPRAARDRGLEER